MQHLSLQNIFSFVVIQFSLFIKVKMPLIVLSLSLLCFTVYVHSQSCVGQEDIDCNKAVPTVFKLSDSSCPCNDASHSGALKFADNQIYVCNGKEWKMVSLTREVSGPYGSEDNPGLSCDDIYDERIRDEQLEDGIYWLHLNMIGKGLNLLFRPGASFLCR